MIVHKNHDHAADVRLTLAVAVAASYTGNNINNIMPRHLIEAVARRLFNKRQRYRLLGLFGGVELSCCRAHLYTHII